MSDNRKKGIDPELYCAKFRGQPCDIIEIAEGLAGQLRATVERLPADLDWDKETPFPMILAEIRHQYTNYDDVIGQLPGCGDWDLDEWQTECLDHPQAHDIIKWAANDVAQGLYEKS